MIDGVKFRVPNMGDASAWRNSDLLEFGLTVNSRTGEVMTDRPLLADTKGLTFKITPSVITPQKPICHVLGSLTKFKNGGDSTENLDYDALCQTIEQLKDYHIDPSVCPLENVEFGLNIVLPCEAKTVINSIVSMPTKPFSELRIDKTTIGRRCDFQQYEVKIYDKGKAIDRKDSNILRVELRVKKMQYLKTIGIKTVQDLTDKEKMAGAGALLLKSLNEVIMLRLDLNECDLLPPSVQKKVLLWTNPQCWAQWSRYQRHRNLKELEAHQQQSQSPNMKNILAHSLCAEWNKALFGEGMGDGLGGKNVAPQTVSFEADRNDLTPLDEDKSDGLGGKNVAIEGDGFEADRNDLTKLDEGKGDGFSGKMLHPKPSPFPPIGATVSGGNRNDLTVKINGYNVTNKTTTTKKIGGVKGVQGEKTNYENGKKKFIVGSGVCTRCGCDISHKRPQSIFCSDRCRKAQFKKNKNLTQQPKATGADTATDLPKPSNRPNHANQAATPSVSGAVEQQKTESDDLTRLFMNLAKSMSA